MHLADDAPCPCGSAKSAGSCCIRVADVGQRDGTVVRQRALVIPQADPRPPKPRTETRVDGCYAACLDDCGGVLSDEHFISHRMLKMLAGDSGRLNVRGMDPRDQDANKRVSPANVIARALCERHNLALKPIETAGNRFFETLASLHGWLHEEPAGTEHLVGINGHDIERWCLKAACGFIARAGRVVPESWARILFGYGDVQRPRGLYAYAAIGDVHRGRDIGIEDVLDVGGEPAGVIVHFLNQELVFSMWTHPVGLTDRHAGKWRVFRPGNLTFNNAANGSRSVLSLSWQDRLHHAVIESEWSASDA